MEICKPWIGSTLWGASSISCPPTLSSGRWSGKISESKDPGSTSSSRQLTENLDVKQFPSLPDKTRMLISPPDLKTFGFRLILIEILPPGLMVPLGDGEAESFALDFSLKVTVFADLFLMTMDPVVLFDWLDSSLRHSGWTWTRLCLPILTLKPVTLIWVI